VTVTTISVNDMHCAACSNKIRSALKHLGDIQTLQFNPVRRQVFVTHADTLPSAALLEQIELAGFHPQLESDSRMVWTENHSLLKRLGIAGLGMMQVMMVQGALYAGMFQGMDEGIRRLLEFAALIFCIPVVVYSAVPFFKSALASLRHGLNMDAPIALAVTLAFSVSLWHTLQGSGEVYYDSVVMFTFLMLGARYLEQRLRQRLGVADSLLATMPRFALQIVGQEYVEKPLEKVVAGDQLWVEEGAQIPVDGTLVSGHATIEEALLTGESDWQNKSKDDALYAGTLNRGPGFQLSVTAALAHSRAAEIDQLAQTAFTAKHSLARIADQVARVFIPTILMLAAITYWLWLQVSPEQALSAALAVLVVSCPCALSLATPAALTAALTRLRQGGILVKNSRALEITGSLKKVFFDKTGTLTHPRPRIESVETFAGFDRNTALDMAAALQAHSSHPLAQAFRRNRVLSAENIEIIPGQGIAGNFRSQPVRIGSAEFCHVPPATKMQSSSTKDVYLSVDNVLAAVFHLTSDIREDAIDTIADLKKRDLSVQMLSGDNPENCATVARQVGIDFIATSLPEAKPEVLKAAQKQSGGVMYVGDGVNDLPALASADVSVATMETSDLVKSKADVLLLTRRLGAISDFLNVGQRTRTIMSENLLWALGYNLIAIPLAAFGYAPPWAAALGMSVSSLIVMLNASRILNTPLLKH
jgi:Cu2+-exporting ATPase